MSKIINGRDLAEKIKDKIVLDVEALCQASKLVERRPSLAIILVGEREDSKIYVRLKEQEAKKVGIDTHTYKMEANTPEADILQTIEFLNKDEEVDAILIRIR
jgi:methylenetetrahydrofolate dehydrogenase (NADP+)/methenyltetrahydrofolate cyclohydrolase